MEIIFFLEFTFSPFFTYRATLQEFSVKPFLCIPRTYFLFRHYFSIGDIKSRR